MGAGLVTAGLTGAGPALARPLRVASLNPCLDAILIRLADRSQIVALSHFSRDPATSSIAVKAAGYPITYGGAEEVAALRPDLVINGFRSSTIIQAALTRLGIRTALFPVPETVAASLAQVIEIGRLIGHPQRGVALAAEIRAAIAAAAPGPEQPRLSALVYQSNGFSSGPGTLMDEMMQRAGLTNAARRYGLTATGSVPLERLVADPPQVLLAGEVHAGRPTWADRVLTHPALQAVGPRMHRAVLPQRLIYCGGPVLIETAAALARARDDALRGAR
jgi:iron complex transport system substrate-binding protein